jgi:hypothetical protein
MTEVFIVLSVLKKVFFGALYVVVDGALSQPFSKSIIKEFFWLARSPSKMLHVPYILVFSVYISKIYQLNLIARIIYLHLMVYIVSWTTLLLRV